MDTLCCTSQGRALGYDVVVDRVTATAVTRGERPVADFGRVDEVLDSLPRDGVCHHIAKPTPALLRVGAGVGGQEARVVER